MSDFTPNTVTIPVDWLTLLSANPTKLPGFLARVRGLYAAQTTAFGGTPAPVAVSAPARSADDTLAFHAALHTALAATCPEAVLPTVAQSATLLSACGDTSDDIATLAETLVLVARDWAAAKTPPYTAHVYGLLKFMDNRPSGDGYPQAKAMADAIRKAPPTPAARAQEAVAETAKLAGVPAPDPDAEARRRRDATLASAEAAKARMAAKAAALTRTSAA